MKKVKGFNHAFTTGQTQVSVNVLGFNTHITNMLKNGSPMTYHYCILDESGDYIDFDVRSIIGFPLDKFCNSVHDNLILTGQNACKNEFYYAKLINRKL